MITVIINPEKKIATINYPAFAKMKPVVVKVRSKEEAILIMQIREKKFVSNSIRSFINSRHYTYVKYEALTPERQKAILHLRNIVNSYSEGSFFRLAKHIASSLLSFSTLMPKNESKAKKHFDNTIVPIINYCIAYYNASVKN